MDLRWLAVVTTLLAGCAGPSQPLADEAPAPLPAPGSTEAPVDDNATLPFAPVPEERVYYLTPGHTLSLAAPAEGTVADTTGFADPAFTLGLGALPAWRAEQPLGAGMRVLGGVAELVFSTQGPQVAVGPSFGIGAAVLWYGEEGRSSPTHAFDGPSTLTPGQEVRAQAELQVPAGGFAFEAGAVPSILLGFTYTQDPANPLQVHTGPNASRLVLRVEPNAPARAASEQALRFEGAFTYNSFLAPTPSAEDTVRRFALPLNATPLRLAARLTGTSAALAQDLDLLLLDPRGEQVWASTSPSKEEGIVLDAMNFPAGPGEYALEVQNFQTVQGTFALDVTLGLA